MDEPTFEHTPCHGKVEKWKNDHEHFDKKRGGNEKGEG